MNHFDSSLLLWANSFVGRWPAFDKGMVFLSNSEMAKGQVFMLLFWWLWFAPEPRRRKNREIIASTFVAAFAAILLGRVLAAFLPFRLRPAFNPELAFVALPGTDWSRSWSAFPSDHAMLFGALATGLFFISRALGAAAYVYGLAIIGLPRVYLGFHHPTDVLAGGALGTAVAWAANSPRARPAISEPLLNALRTHERAFYTVFFLVSTEIMTMFADPRALATGLFHLVRRGH
jgi:membrane-associated phospholipid phosphatase